MVTNLKCYPLEYHTASSHNIFHPVTLFWKRVNQLFFFALHYTLYVEHYTRELQLPIWYLWFDSARNKTREHPKALTYIQNQTFNKSTLMCIMIVLLTSVTGPVSSLGSWSESEIVICFPLFCLGYNFLIKLNIIISYRSKHQSVYRKKLRSCFRFETVSQCNIAG